ncbi:class I glutamine amidotransferase-like protein [Mycena olivaceomarginata]|uniref:Class I glutamine amidotransferase-like protein n=1 Tax=Mycena albidolilacea TaxID=1033008 RepID=A0AAD7EHN3_9AGAR|nr:class I glutamine amidotransferase-like protein [Mycena albidolilacea]KAJ7793295.1 class I glutamine amidotransferase-like protein [Mycena olivaceomarginata]
MPETLSIAVCVSDGVTLSDFITPVEILANLNSRAEWASSALGDVPYRVAIDYLSPTMEPVVSVSGPDAPTINPTLTYAGALAAGKQFDILWVPAGPGPDFVTGESHIPEDEITFIAQQAPKAKYVISVCTGAFQLALAGVLDGKRATTNKLFYRTIVAATSKKIEWVPEARWVVAEGGKVWTSSGVTAGSDMALAFVEHLTNAKIARHIRGGFEIPERTEKDDPFAAFHGLV